MSKDGYSRKGLFGDIIHYDSKGNKVGKSTPGLSVGTPTMTLRVIR